MGRLKFFVMFVVFVLIFAMGNLIVYAGSSSTTKWKFDKKVAEIVFQDFLRKGERFGEVEVARFEARESSIGVDSSNSSSNLVYRIIQYPNVESVFLAFSKGFGVRHITSKSHFGYALDGLPAYYVLACQKSGNPQLRSWANTYNVVTLLAKYKDGIIDREAELVFLRDSSAFARYSISGVIDQLFHSQLKSKKKREHEALLTPAQRNKLPQKEYEEIIEHIPDYEKTFELRDGKTGEISKALVLYYTFEDGLIRYTSVLDRDRPDRDQKGKSSKVTKDAKKCPTCRWNNWFVGVDRGEHSHQTEGTPAMITEDLSGVLFTREGIVHVKASDGKTYCGQSHGGIWHEPLQKRFGSNLVIVKDPCDTGQALLVGSDKKRILFAQQIFLKSSSLNIESIPDFYLEGRLPIENLPLCTKSALLEVFNK